MLRPMIRFSHYRYLQYLLALRPKGTLLLTRARGEATPLRAAAVILLAFDDVAIFMDNLLANEGSATGLDEGDASRLGMDGACLGQAQAGTAGAAMLARRR